jgi:hypothetical protein
LHAAATCTRCWQDERERDGEDGDSAISLFNKKKREAEETSLIEWCLADALAS